MHILAINGSPRRKGNTKALLEEALAGAAEAAGPDTETRLVRLYDLQYTGCRSCFHCKKLGSDLYGHCVIKDDLKPILQEASQADVLLLGSPIYFGYVGGMMHSFLERLLFPYLVYDREHSSLAPKHMPIGCIYTMNLSEEGVEKRGYRRRLALLEESLGLIFTRPTALWVTDTWQFSDYSRYASWLFDAEAKRRRREEHFPQDLADARALGRKLALRAAGMQEK